MQRVRGMQRATPATDVQERCCSSSRNERSTIRMGNAIDKGAVVERCIWYVTDARMETISAEAVDVIEHRKTTRVSRTVYSKISA
jgi:hypothetical protein